MLTARKKSTLEIIAREREEERERRREQKGDGGFLRVIT